MSGTRRPMAVNLAAGGKHWTKAEIEQREKTEIAVVKPEGLKCPKWLGKEAGKVFRRYAKALLLSGLPVSELDTLSLARMCDAEVTYGRAAKMRDAALNGLEAEDDPEKRAALTLDLATWMKTMGSCEKIARGAANDLGCTIGSRCRLVVPQVEELEEDPFEALKRQNV